MLTALYLLSGCYLAGCAAMIHGFITAPMGEETEEEGFQMAWCNHSPETRDVSCVWTVAGALA